MVKNGEITQKNLQQWASSLSRNKNLTGQYVLLELKKGSDKEGEIIFESRNGIFLGPEENTKAIFYPWSSINKIIIDPYENI
jgi:hypothetical protein